MLRSGKAEIRVGQPEQAGLDAEILKIDPRRQRSDAGICASARHASPDHKSDHAIDNPEGAGRAKRILQTCVQSGDRRQRRR